MPTRQPHPDLLEVSDELLDRLEYLLLAGIRRLSPLAPEYGQLALMSTMCPGAEPFPERE